MNSLNQQKAKSNIVHLPSKIDEVRIFEAGNLLIYHFGLLVNHENIKPKNFAFVEEISKQDFFHKIIRKIAIEIRRFEIQRFKNKSISSEIYPPEIFECSEFKAAIEEVIKLFKEFKLKQKS